MKDYFSCVECGKQFAYQGALVTHRRDVHKGYEEFNCSFEGCQYIGKSRKVWVKHINYNHKNTQKYRCDVCGDDFGGDKRLKIHIGAHHVETACRFSCGKVFENKQNEIKHKNSAHSRIGGKLRSHELEVPKPCEFCGKQFAWKSGLREHLKSKHSPLVITGLRTTDSPRDIWDEVGEKRGLDDDVRS